MKKLMLTNHAVALGAYEAGVRVVSSYPGTPSTEITEECSKYKEIHTEWAPNEKVALEVATGAAIAGARALSCMKHVGVNVAADPLFTAAYTGVNAGLVLAVADDPACTVPKRTGFKVLCFKRPCSHAGACRQPGSQRLYHAGFRYQRKI